MMLIESPENAGVKRVCKLLGDKKFRMQEGVFVLEGLTLLQEAIGAGAEIEKLFVLDGMENRVPQELFSKISLINQRVLEKISDVKAPQGVVFTCAMPKAAQSFSGGKILALENISDPGNMGTILRTADALQMDGVVLIGDCVDVFSPKVVRATMGSLFRVPIFYMSAEQLALMCAQEDIPLYCAALRPEAVTLDKVDLKRAAVVIGSEAHGISEETRKKCAKSIIIPIKGAESLNAAIAAAIFMWEMR